MKSLHGLLAALGLAALGTGCAGYRESMSKAGGFLPIIRPGDIDQATLYGEALPGHLGLSRKQVSVSPNFGRTVVVISGVQDQAERERIAAELEALNRKNPQLNPLAWTFQ